MVILSLVATVDALGHSRSTMNASSFITLVFNAETHAKSGIN